jgi:hypothetical protein
MAALEAALIAEVREPTPQDMLSHGMAHANHLLRELYRRYRTLSHPAGLRGALPRDRPAAGLSPV